MRSKSNSPRRDPVTSSDLRKAAVVCAATLSPFADRDWSIKAHGLRWTCRYTLDHVLNCLAWYAHDLAAEIPDMQGAARSGCPRAKITDLISSIPALAEVLALVTDGKSNRTRAWHDWGIGDPEGFRAMGTIEIILHTWDVSGAFNAPFDDPGTIDDISSRLLTRLFPDAPIGHPPLTTLLYVTGRGELEGLAQIRKWQWHSNPVD